MSTRYYDFKELEKDWKTADTEKRKKIEEIGHKIANESEETEKIRRELISANRAGNVHKVKELSKYMERQRTHNDVR